MPFCSFPLLSLREPEKKNPYAKSERWWRSETFLFPGTRKARRMCQRQARGWAREPRSPGVCPALPSVSHREEAELVNSTRGTSPDWAAKDQGCIDTSHMRHRNRAYFFASSAPRLRGKKCDQVTATAAGKGCKLLKVFSLLSPLVSRPLFPFFPPPLSLSLFLKAL